MSIALLEHAAALLGELTKEVMFVGAATIDLWIDPDTTQLEATIDVDIVIEVSTRPQLHRFEEQLAAQGFSPDDSSSVICRWKHVASELQLDVMPTDKSVLGFASHWQARAIKSTASVQLPSGTTIRCATPPYLLAMKLEAFSGRGRGDHLGSKDVSDLVTLVDGRERLVDEVLNSDDELRSYVASAIEELGSIAGGGLRGVVYGAMRPNASSQSRAESVVLPRMAALATSG